mgnify:CR=1 FL=1
MRDARCPSLPLPRGGSSRHIHLLLYLDTLQARDGGKLAVYSHTRQARGLAYRQLKYPSGQRVRARKKIRTAAIGGEWTGQTEDFTLKTLVTPRSGRAVIMDCRSAENVHSVSSMTSDRYRTLLEAWFEVHIPPVEEAC